MALVIDSFRDEYAFLSNFYPCDVDVCFVFAPKLHWQMPTAEHAFHAIKVIKSNLDDREKMLWLWDFSQLPSPNAAKQAGRKLKIDIHGWDRIAYMTMGRIVQQKFKQHADLADLLVATGDATLIEGNTWGDRLWGQVNGVGENRLGILLMQVRQQIVDSRAGVVVE